MCGKQKVAEEADHSSQLVGRAGTTAHLEQAVVQLDDVGGDEEGQGPLHHVVQCQPPPRRERLLAGERRALGGPVVGGTFEEMGEVPMNLTMRSSQMAWAKPNEAGQKRAGSGGGDWGAGAGAGQSLFKTSQFLATQAKNGSKEMHFGQPGFEQC